MKFPDGIQELGVVGDRLYAQVGESIRQFDLSTPEKPQEITQVKQGEILRSLFTDSGISTGTWEGVHLLRFAKPRG